jgi:hypothetical protein
LKTQTDRGGRVEGRAWAIVIAPCGQAEPWRAQSRSGTGEAESVGDGAGGNKVSGGREVDVDRHRQDRLVLLSTECLREIDIGNTFIAREFGDLGAQRIVGTTGVAMRLHADGHHEQLEAHTAFLGHAPNRSKVGFDDLSCKGSPGHPLVIGQRSTHPAGGNAA